MRAPDNATTLSITLPRREQMESLARLATTAIACQAGFNIDQADDLNTAIDELVRTYKASGDARAPLTFLFLVFPDRLEIEAGAYSEPVLDGDSETSRYRRFLLEKMADQTSETKLTSGQFQVCLSKKL